MASVDMSVFDAPWVHERYARSRQGVADDVDRVRYTGFGRVSWRDRSVLNSAARGAEGFLAMADEVFIDVRAEYMRMLLATKQYRRLREHLGTALRTTCQFQGVRSPAAEQLRTCGVLMANNVSRRRERAVDRARQRLAEAETRTGPTSEETLSAAWRLADLLRASYEALGLTRLYERKLTELRHELGDDNPRVSNLALLAAEECLALGEVEAALRLFEHHYRIEDARLAAEGNGRSMRISTPATCDG